jgi:KDO2-lipid IV(A) lauroyltransferase
MKLAVPSGQVVTTYRALRQRKLTQLLLALRKASGCLYFERRDEGPQLKETMKRPSILLGLLADQHAGDGGLRLPVFGREASVSAAPAVMAKRYGCRLFPSACFRTGLGQWKLVLGEEIPLRENGKRRNTEAITRDIIAAQEDYIRRDPANWFWVHNRWKPSPKAK